MGLFDDLNRAGLLAIALNPEWVDQTAFTGAPISATSGVFLQNSPKALVQVAAREDVSKREARVKIDTFDLTVTVYTVTISGTAVVYDASSELPASNAALVAGIAAKIEADGVATLVVDAITDPDDADTILIIGKAEPDWFLDATVAGGTGALTATAAATGFDVQLYSTNGGIIKTASTGAPGRWVSPADSLYAGMDYHGWIERFDVAGLARYYAEIKNVTKHASDGSGVTATIANVAIGPAVLEATS